MKNALSIIVTLLCACGVATASDYIRIDADSVYAGSTDTLEFIITRECPEPDTVYGIILGFVMTATGTTTWSLNSGGDPAGFIKYHDTDWFYYGGLLILPKIDGVPPDSILVEGASKFPIGMPIITEEPLFGMILDFGTGGGELCIDSSFIVPAGQWRAFLMGPPLTITPE